MKTSEFHAVAIPTEYEGVKFKSRLEAQCAFLFDQLDWEWEYEPRSFMLPNGIAYTPDFYIPSCGAFWECRGYSTDKGEAQIQGFASLLQSVIKAPNGDDIDNYVVLYGDREALTVSMSGYTGMICILHCKWCGWLIAPIGKEPTFNGTDMHSFETRCGSCSAPVAMAMWTRWDGKACVDRAAIITASAGKVLVNGFGVDEFKPSPPSEADE